MTKLSLRNSILDAGLDVMFGSGYHAASVRDITKAAQAPLGSFTNHFESKEVFALEVLERYFVYVTGLVGQALSDETVSPRQRILNYFELIGNKLANDHWLRGCLIGDLSLGVSSHSELLRTRLQKIFEEWRQPFAACITEAQASGEISSDTNAHELADFLIASWHGAILRMKVDRNPKALTRFKIIISKKILV